MTSGTKLPKWNNRARRATLALAALSGSMQACSGSSSGWRRALPMGLYDVSAPRCLSTQSRPIYPAPNYAAALFDFDALIQHTLLVGQATTTETLQSAVCTLRVTRSIYQNFDDEFTQRSDREHAFEPPTCNFYVTFQSHEFPVGVDYTDLFTDSDDRTADIPFAVTATPAGFDLTSIDRFGFGAAWAKFGCAASDSVQISVSKSL